jgi:hypothetical protein
LRRTVANDYISYIYYKLNGWESRSLYLALDGERIGSSYIDHGIVPRPRSDYQVLARRRILSGDVFCVVVGALTEYDSFDDIPDIIGGVPTFIRREPSGKCIAVSTTNQLFDLGYSVAHAMHENYNNRRTQVLLRPDFNYSYFMRHESPGNISVNCRVVFLPIGNLFLLISTTDIEEHEEVFIENASMCFTNVVVKEEHVYKDARTFFQNWINGPDCKYFHDHAGRDIAFEKARGIEIGGMNDGVDIEEAFDSAGGDGSASAVEVEAVGVGHGTGTGNGNDTGNGNGTVVSADEDHEHEIRGY